MKKIQIILIPLFGPPGCGKGSIIFNLKNKAQQNPDIAIITVEMGTRFREISQHNSHIKNIMDTGSLLSNPFANNVFNELLNKSISHYLQSGQTKEKVIVLLDGYPRTLPQWMCFLNHFSAFNTAAVFIELSEQIVMHRSTIRRICPNCGTTFSIEERQTCPKCQSEGIIRNDDLMMKRRLQVFKIHTAPVILRAKNIFALQITVSGNDISQASEQIWKFLQTL